MRREQIDHMEGLSSDEKVKCIPQTKLGGQTPIHVNWIELLDESVFRILHSVPMYSTQYSPLASVFMTTSCREEYRKPREIITHYCSTLVLGNTLSHPANLSIFPRLLPNNPTQSIVQLWRDEGTLPPVVGDPDEAASDRRTQLLLKEGVDYVEGEDSRDGGLDLMRADSEIK